MNILPNHQLRLLAHCMLIGVLLSGCSRSNAQPHRDSPSNKNQTVETDTGRATLREIEGLLQAAELAERDTDFSLAAESLEAAVAACRQLPVGKRKEPLAAALAWLGNISTKRERIDDAIRFLREAQQVAGQASKPDAELQIAVGQELATALHLSGQHKEAAKHVDAMIELLKRELSKKKQAEPLLELLALKVSVLAARKELLTAAETGDQMFDILNTQEDRDPGEAALLLYEVAELWRDAGRLESANLKYAAAVRLTSAPAFDPEVAQAVFQACLEHCQKTGDTAGVTYFRQKVLDAPATTSQHVPTAPAQIGPVVGMSEAKQLAYEDVVRAKQRFEEAQNEWDEQYRIWRKTRDQSQQWAGRASALGVYHSTFEGRAPDPHAKLEAFRAREEYVKAVRHFQTTR